MTVPARYASQPRYTDKYRACGPRSLGAHRRGLFVILCRPARRGRQGIVEGGALAFLPNHLASSGEDRVAFVQALARTDWRSRQKISHANRAVLNTPFAFHDLARIVAFRQARYGREPTPLDRRRRRPIIRYGRLTGAFFRVPVTIGRGRGIRLPARHLSGPRDASGNRKRFVEDGGALVAARP